MKKIIFLLFFCFSVNLYAKVNYFELYGDIFSFLPAFAGIYSLTQKDYEGLTYLAVSASSVLAITFGIKYSFVEISKNNKRLAKISLRPDGKSYDGFPSGHTSSAFAGAAFMQKRYGSIYGIPASILATLVGISRVSAKKHTIFQVISGAALGYSMAYFITQQKYDISILPDIDNKKLSNGLMQKYYGLSFNVVF